MIRILCLHIAEKQASYRYRVAQFLPYWKEYGIEMHTVCITGKSYLEKLRIVLDCGRYDYVWLQRKPLTWLFTELISRRSRLLYDFDDALYAKESYREKAPKPVHPGSKQTIRRLASVLKHASIVFAGSPALADYARRYNPGSTFIVPTAYGKIDNPPSGERREEKVTVGWIGNVANLYFLSLIDEATAAIQKKFPATRFSVMSGEPPKNLKTNWEFVPWSKEGEDSWLRSIDIGVMPLNDDEWSRGKCAFKLLQYMAYGKPVVGSSVGANLQAIVDGVSGYLAADTYQWKEALEALVSQQELRIRMGKESLNHFLSHYERVRVQQQMADLLHAHLKSAEGKTEHRSRRK